MNSRIGKWDEGREAHLKPDRRGSMKYWIALLTISRWEHENRPSHRNRMCRGIPTVDQHTLTNSMIPYPRETAVLRSNQPKAKQACRKWGRERALPLRVRCLRECRLKPFTCLWRKPWSVRGNQWFLV